LFFIVFLQSGFARITGLPGFQVAQREILATTDSHVLKQLRQKKTEVTGKQKKSNIP